MEDASDVRVSACLSLEFPFEWNVLATFKLFKLSVLPLYTNNVFKVERI